MVQRTPTTGLFKQQKTNKVQASNNSTGSSDNQIKQKPKTVIDHSLPAETEPKLPAAQIQNRTKRINNASSEIVLSFKHVDSDMAIFKSESEDVKLGQALPSKAKHVVYINVPESSPLNGKVVSLSWENSELNNDIFIKSGFQHFPGVDNENLNISRDRVKQIKQDLQGYKLVRGDEAVSFADDIAIRREGNHLIIDNLKTHKQIAAYELIRGKLMMEVQELALKSDYKFQGNGNENTNDSNAVISFSDNNIYIPSTEANPDYKFRVMLFPKDGVLGFRLGNSNSEQLGAKLKMSVMLEGENLDTNSLQSDQNIDISSKETTLAFHKDKSGKSKEYHVKLLPIGANVKFGTSIPKFKFLTNKNGNDYLFVSVNTQGASASQNKTQCFKVDFDNANLIPCKSPEESDNNIEEDLISTLGEHKQQRAALPDELQRVFDTYHSQYFINGGQEILSKDLLIDSIMSKVDYESRIAKSQKKIDSGALKGQDLIAEKDEIKQSQTMIKNAVNDLNQAIDKFYGAGSHERFKNTWVQIETLLKQAMHDMKIKEAESAIPQLLSFIVNNNITFQQGNIDSAYLKSFVNSNSEEARLKFKLWFRNHVMNFSKSHEIKSLDAKQLEDLLSTITRTDIDKNVPDFKSRALQSERETKNKDQLFRHELQSTFGQIIGPSRGVAKEIFAWLQYPEEQRSFFADYMIDRAKNINKFSTLEKAISSLAQVDLTKLAKVHEDFIDSGANENQNVKKIINSDFQLTDSELEIIQSLKKSSFWFSREQEHLKNLQNYESVAMNIKQWPGYDTLEPQNKTLVESFMSIYNKSDSNKIQLRRLLQMGNKHFGVVRNFMTIKDALKSSQELQALKYLFNQNKLVTNIQSVKKAMNIINDESFIKNNLQAIYTFENTYRNFKEKFTAISKEYRNMITKSATGTVERQDLIKQYNDIFAEEVKDILKPLAFMMLQSQLQIANKDYQLISDFINRTLRDLQILMIKHANSLAGLGDQFVRPEDRYYAINADNIRQYAENSSNR